eukprot:TRINITY_DN5038_c0_g1_i2.p3 TRINITY_DN5038_c0_g1~~TRINITY_DN5038_c0_g1_i2.p3  ORF type:complete len:170 (-),score=17.21 TRINITY_DN5038_c0_g1_i2:344-853(-)
MSDQAALQQWFRAVDSDGSGQIDSKELAKALAMGNLHFSLSMTAQMIRVHDKDQSGSIGFQEFVHLHQFLLHMQQCFQYYDRDRSGALSSNEVFQSLHDAGFKLDQNVFHVLMSTFDPDKTNSLGMEEFIAMTLFLKSASAVFTAFDRDGSGSIALDYNQFIYAAANCR